MAFVSVFALHAFAVGGASSTGAGVYTNAQATSGKVVYTKQCAECHGADLSGADQNPPLAGSDFLAKWKGMTLADLYLVIHATMPATAPGTLTPQQAVEILAYILQANKMPSGKIALPANSDNLKNIQIAAPAPTP